MAADPHPPHGRGVGAPAGIGRGAKVFAAPPGQPRARRASDLVLLVPALAGVVLAVLAYPPTTLEPPLRELIADLPHWLDPVWAFLADLLWLWALVLVGVALVRRRIMIVGQALASVVLAAAGGILAARVALGSWPNVVDAVLGTRDGPPFPETRVAIAAAVIVALSPHLVRPLRSAGRWLLLLGVAGAAVVGGGTPTGTLTAVLIAVAAAAAVRLVTGTSLGRPGLEDVRAALAELGVPAHELEAAERQVAGVFHVRGLGEEGQSLLVKVYGRDAYDSQLVARLWRRLWYRGSGPPLRLGRLQSAEHEAFVTLLVANAGLATRDVVTAAATVDDDALLVLRGDARPLGSLEAELVDDAVLAGAWSALALLAELRIGHRQIDPATVVLVGSEVGLVDFGGATVAPDADQLATDRAQLLATTAALAGTERALRAAIAALGADGVAALLPYLQPAALSPSLRRALKSAGIDMDDVRKEAAAAVGAEPPELVKLRRVTRGSLVQIALLALASYAIVSAAESVDWGEIRTTLDGAGWGWIAAAFVVAQLPRVTQALSTLGSVPAPLPLGPVYAMQLATGYMNVALPSNLARMAVNIRFFQRQGLSPPIAVAAGAIDSFASTVIQAILLVALLVFSESTLALDLSVPSGGSLTLVWIVVGLLVASALALSLVRRVRRAIATNVRRWWPDVRAALSTLRATDKLLLLVFGSLATEVLFASALGLFVRGFGYDLDLTELLVINISVALLGSLVPVPGNIGVAELGLTVGLTSAGMTPEAALAAVLLYRISTYYLPPLWGFVAMRWLQRNRYL